MKTVYISNNKRVPQYLSLCLYVVCCVLYNDVHILIEANTVSVRFYSIMLTGLTATINLHGKFIFRIPLMYLSHTIFATLALFILVQVKPNIDLA